MDKIKEIDELERLSDCVRKGEPIGFIEALAVIDYQSNKPRPKTLWQKITSWKI